jgi:putative DNA primase/helicase
MDSTGNGSAYGAVPEQFKRLHGWMASGGGVDGKGLTDAEGYNVSRAVADVWRSFEEVVEEDHERGCGIGWVIQSGYVVFDLDDAVDENGDLRKQFKALVEGVDTYIERSFSGRGLHAFVKSSVIPEKDK